MAVGTPVYGTAAVTGDDATNPTSTTPSLTGYAAGDLLIAAACWAPGSSTGDATGITTATEGWTAHTDTVGTTATGGSFIFAKLFWRIATSTSETWPTVTFTGGGTGTSGQVGIVLPLYVSGADSTTPFGASGANYGNTGAGASTTIQTLPTAGTVATGNEAITFGARDTPSSFASLTVTANWTRGTEVSTTNASDLTFVSAYRAGADADIGTFGWTVLDTQTANRTGRMFTILAGSLSMQEIAPDADVTTTGWSTTPLWSKLSDDSDATVITATLA